MRRRRPAAAPLPPASRFLSQHQQEVGSEAAISSTSATGGQEVKIGAFRCILLRNERPGGSSTPETPPPPPTVINNLSEAPPDSAVSIVLKSPGGQENKVVV